MAGAARTTESGTGFVEHPLRGFALSEIHARPFLGISTPRLLLHFAFLTDASAAAEDRGRLIAHCTRLGVVPPAPKANHHVVSIGNARLRWEIHSEFTTYSWDIAPPASEAPPRFSDLIGEGFVQPGPLIVATRLNLVKEDGGIDELLHSLDPGTTAVSLLREGRAVGATDFQVNPDGMTHILLVDRDLFPHEVGPIVTRLLELETYRTLALLGLPEARRLQPVIFATESGLKDATTRIGRSPGLDENRELLESLTALAGDLEAAVAHSAFRFGATRAYYEIVENRLGAIREGPLEGYTRLSSFLQRRMAPAVRTCNGVEARLNEMSGRLARATELLRTRIEVDLEQQNRELLAAMNARARLQMRLQQWVEGLSVAAVSYYVVSLIFYLARGVDTYDIGVDPYRVTAFAIPPVMVGIWLFVRLIRRRGHAEEAEVEQGHS